MGKNVARVVKLITLKEFVDQLRLKQRNKTNKYNYTVIEEKQGIQPFLIETLGTYTMYKQLVTRHYMLQ